MLILRRPCGSFTGCFSRKSHSTRGRWRAAVADGSSGTGDESGFAEQPDWYELANRWLDLAQPMLIAWLEREKKRRRRYREIRLTNLTPHLTLHPPSGEQLLTLLENPPPDRTRPKPHRRRDNRGGKECPKMTKKDCFVTSSDCHS